MDCEAFCIKLKRIRKGKIDDFGRPLSQEKAARMFNVSLSTWRAWEHEPPRHLPDSRSRDLLETLWPELFNR
jgi:DNA-binding transcriptional regulator YiaG